MKKQTQESTKVPKYKAHTHIHTILLSCKKKKQSIISNEIHTYTHVVKKRSIRNV